MQVAQKVRAGVTGFITGFLQPLPDHSRWREHGNCDRRSRRTALARSNNERKSRTEGRLRNRRFGVDWVVVRLCWAPRPADDLFVT